MCTKGRDVINADYFQGRQAHTSVRRQTGSRRRLFLVSPFVTALSAIESNIFRYAMSPWGPTISQALEIMKSIPIPTAI